MNAPTPYSLTPGAFGAVVRSLMDIESLLLGIDQLLKGNVEEPEKELIRAAVERGLRLKSNASEALPNDGDWTEELAAAYEQRLASEEPDSEV